MKKQPTQPTPVIFRTFKHGTPETYALFPEIPATMSPGLCMSYAHVGQHSAALASCLPNTRPATPEEIAPLREELERIGYVLRPVKRFTRAHFETRCATIRAQA